MTSHFKLKLTYCPSNIHNVNTFTDERGQVRLYGVMHKVAQVLASSLGASFTLQAPADKQWGAIINKGLHAPQVFATQNYIYCRWEKVLGWYDGSGFR